MSKPQRIHLREYQRQFVDRFLGSPEDRVHVLVAPPGSGSRVCSVEIASHIFEEKSDARVLILTERQLLREQWRRRFSGAGIQARSLEGTRQNLREILRNDQSSELVWPESTIVTMSAGSIQRFGDISKSVLDTNWDLLIWDWFSPSDGMLNLLKELRRANNFKKILLTTHDQNTDWPRVLPGVELTVWDWGSLLSEFPANAAASIEVVELAFERTPEELEIQQKLNQLIENHSGVRSTKSLTLTRLKRAADSSPLALQEHLRQFKPSLASIAVGEIPISEHLDSEDLDDDELAEIIDELSYRKMRGIEEEVRTMQQLLDDLTVDSKLEAIQRYIADHTAGQSHTVIWCRFVSTARYVHTALADSERTVSLLIGEGDVSERLKVLGNFESEGGVLVATFAAMKGLEFSGDSIMLYDGLPDAGRTALSILLQRIHNHNQVKIIVFADDSEAVKDLRDVAAKG